MFTVERKFKYLAWSLVVNLDRIQNVLVEADTRRAVDDDVQSLSQLTSHFRVYPQSWLDQVSLHSDHSFFHSLNEIRSLFEQVGE